VAAVEVLEKQMSLSNSLGLLGRKVGMMRLFTDDGDAVPVTVVDVSNNRVTQVKTQENDGYVALQVTFGSRKASRVTKPQAGHLAKAGVEAGEIIQEFRVTADTAAKYAGCTAAGGRRVCRGPEGGRAGHDDRQGLRRHDQAPQHVSQRASHGNSRSHNVPGSIGMAQDPGRVCSRASA
jgi:large subunit ribosomal protein L3